MKGTYREYNGNNWTSEFELDSFPIDIDTEEVDQEELLLNIELKLLDTSNNCLIELPPFMIRSSQRGFSYLQDNGVDFVTTSRDFVESNIKPNN